MKVHVAWECIYCCHRHAWTWRAEGMSIGEHVFAECDDCKAKTPARIEKLGVGCYVLAWVDEKPRNIYRPLDTFGDMVVR